MCGSFSPISMRKKHGDHVRCFLFAFPSRSRCCQQFPETCLDNDCNYKYKVGLRWLKWPAYKPMASQPTTTTPKLPSGIPMVIFVRSLLRLLSNPYSLIKRKVKKYKDSYAPTPLDVADHIRLLLGPTQCWPWEFHWPRHLAWPWDRGWWGVVATLISLVLKGPGYLEDIPW